MRGQQTSAGILSYFVRHGTAANLLLVVMLALGLSALPRMRAQFFPDVIVDAVNVSVKWEGAGAEDVDRAILQVMEPALLAVDGVTESSAVASEGRATINLEFEPGHAMDQAVEDVQAAVDGLTSLPDDIDLPSVQQSRWRDRVTDVVIAGPLAPEQLGRVGDELIARLFARGVTRAQVRGLAAPETLIEVPMRALVQYDLSLAEIAAAIGKEASTSPAGDLGQGTARVRTGVEKRTARAISQIVLRANTDGTPLTIGDVARVEILGADRERAFFVGQNPALSIAVERSSGGDAIGIQHQVEAAVEDQLRTAPDGVTIDLIRTRAAAISARLDILMDNGLVGLGLVVALLFLFLNAQTAFWVAAGVPVAMLAAIAMMYAAGLTINMISLFALIITLGIVVDDAIVVGEHADYRARTLGESPTVAAENAARRMAVPVFSATLTTVIAFFGLVAIGGRFGDLIIAIPFTVIAVLLASLVECFLILPNHMRHALTHNHANHWYDWPSRQVNRGFEWTRDRLFRPLMAWVVRLRYPIVAGAVVLLASQVALVIDGTVTWRFFNAPERSTVTGNFAMAEGATRQDALEMMAEMQRAAEALGTEYQAEYGRNPLDFVIAQVGGTSGRGLRGVGNKDADLLGSISIELIDPDLRPYSSSQFVRALQDKVRRHPKAEIVAFRGMRSGPGGDSLSVQLSGTGSAQLKAASEDLQQALAQFPEVSGLQDNLAYDKEELILELTAQGQALGFTTDTMGRVLRNRLNGIEAASYAQGRQSAKIYVRLPTRELSSDFLDRMLLRTAAGQYVPLGDVVSVTRQSGFSTIRRENGIQLIEVSGDIAEDDPARATQITERLRDVILPDIESRHDVTTRLSGLAEQERAFLDDARTGLILCLIGIFLALAWVFSSWTRPLVVMSVIPFGLVGAIYGHLIWDVPLSMFSVVGLLGMTGIIINDSIVLVTTIDEYADARGTVPAIIDGACDRLRPVILTTLTTVFGLAPLLYEVSSQAQFLKPTVITLVYGLGFGMGLVLLVVPAFIAIQSDVRRILTSTRRAVMHRASAVRTAVVLAGGGCVAAWGWWVIWPITQDQRPDWPSYGLACLVICVAVYAGAGLMRRGRR